MSLPVTIINEYLRLLFNHKITSDIALLAENIFNHMKKTIKFNELDLTNKYVGLTTSSYTLYVHHTFISTNDLVNCCQASSFVPMVTKKHHCIIIMETHILMVRCHIGDYDNFVKKNV